MKNYLATQDLVCSVWVVMALINVDYFRSRIVLQGKLMLGAFE